MYKGPMRVPIFSGKGAFWGPGVVSRFPKKARETGGGGRGRGVVFANGTQYPTYREVQVIGNERIFTPGSMVERGGGGVVTLRITFLL